MNTEALFLFLILLLGLVLCSFLGGNCNKEPFSGKFSGTFKVNTTSSGASTSSSNLYDNYNHFSGSSTQLSPGSTYYGPNGTTATVITNSDGTQSLQIILPSNSSSITFTQSQDNSNNYIETYTNYYGNRGEATVFNGPNGSTATVVTGNNGQKAIKVTTEDGVYYYHSSGSYSNLTDTSTQYYGSTGAHIQPAPTTLAYTGSNGVNAGAVTGPYRNTSYYAEGPAGNAVTGVSYTSALPPGIPRSQIPPGDEDLYILKSAVVPPVCPACPSSSVCPRQEPCPPCPACARCPEPSFECKKVPNYSAINNDYLPAPVLNDFSTFGM